MCFIVLSVQRHIPAMVLLATANLLLPEYCLFSSNFLWSSSTALGDSYFLRPLVYLCLLWQDVQQDATCFSRIWVYLHPLLWLTVNIGIWSESYCWLKYWDWVIYGSLWHVLWVSDQVLFMWAELTNCLVPLTFLNWSWELAPFSTLAININESNWTIWPFSGLWRRLLWKEGEHRSRWMVKVSQCLKIF